MVKSNKNIAILNASPTINESSKAALDVALIYGSFEQKTSLFYQGEGVWQLTQNQNMEQVNVKNFIKTMAALEFYDIEHIYVCSESLSERSLSQQFHIDNVQVLNREVFSEKLHQHHIILRF